MLDRLPDDWHPGRMRQWNMYTHVLPTKTWSMKEFPYSVTLDWSRRPSMESWDRITTWTLWQFGLPGIRYQTEVSTERMTWYFSDKLDHLVMTLAWGNDNEL